MQVAVLDFIMIFNNLNTEICAWHYQNEVLAKSQVCNGFLVTTTQTGRAPPIVTEVITLNHLGFLCWLFKYSYPQLVLLIIEISDSGLDDHKISPMFIGFRKM